MILHLIRHPPPSIAPGICYDRLDVSAEIPAAAIAALRAQLPSGLPVYSSPLRRCLDLAHRLHPAPVVDARLAEMDFGAWEGRSWDAIPRAELDAWAADIAGYAPPGGESPAQLQARALDFVAGLNVPEAVLVTHAGVIRMLLAYWQELPPESWSQLLLAYASCTRLHVPR